MMPRLTTLVNKSGMAGVLVLALGLGTIGTVLLSPLARASQALSAVDEYSSEFVRSARLGVVIEEGGAKLILAYRLAEHYHLYWFNPGDSGLAPEFDLVDAPAGLSLGKTTWPLPDRFLIGPLVNYGYSHGVEYRVELLLNGAPIKDLSVLSSGFSLDLQWLVCRIDCVPERARLRYSPTGSSVLIGQRARQKAGAQPLLATILPELPEQFASAEDGLALALRAPEPHSVPDFAAERDWHLATEDNGFLDLSSKQRLVYDAAQGRWLLLVRRGLLYRQIIDRAQGQGVRLAAVLLASDATGVAGQTRDQSPQYLSSIAAESHPIDIELPLRQALAPAGANTETALSMTHSASGPTAQTGASLSSWLWAALFAFLGGIILNIMPCVLPVLSIKLGSIVQLARQSGARRQSVIAILCQTAGIQTAVLALAALLLSLRHADEILGWGFQLQSPGFVLFICIVMLLVGLNLSGVFSVSIPVSGRMASAGQTANVALKHYFSGLLLVVLASPCTAPFMVSAFGYAWQQTPSLALTIFVFLGLGLAAPYLALMIFPGIVDRLPRPGRWSSEVQSMLAFPIYATVLWLLWVISQQVDAAGLAWVFTLLWSAGFAAWCYGRFATQLSDGARRLASLLLICWLLALTIVPVSIGLVGSTAHSPSPESRTSMHSQSWNPQRLEQLRQQGEPVFINYTAAWCATCLWNESRVFDQAGFVEALSSSGTHYLVADWTRRDPEIGAALARHGRFSVPTYIFYPRGVGSEAILLGQLPDLESVISLLRQSRP